MGIRDTTAGIRNTTVSGRSIPAFSSAPPLRHRPPRNAAEQI
jgi:hypothetical protein